MDSVKQYHDILCDFLPDVLGYIVLDYAIFPTQEFFLKSFDNIFNIGMVCEKNIVYNYYGFKGVLEKHVYNADTYIYSDKIFIHKNLIHVLDGRNIYVFNKNCEQISEQTLEHRNLKLFVHNDKIYKHYFAERNLYFSEIYEQGAYRITFDVRIFSLKYKDKNIYALLWNNNIIKHSIDNNISTLVHEHNSETKSEIKDFCIVDDNIYILRIGSYCKIDIYDHHTQFIRSFTEKPLYRAYSIDCHNDILYLRSIQGKVNIYEIRHKSLLSKN